MQITSAMKMVSAAKLKRAQDAITQMRPYANKLSELLENLSASLDGSEGGVYTQNRDVKNVLLVTITSNRGLCGGFNTYIIKEAKELINKEYSNANIKILSIGKKSSEHFDKSGFNVVSKHDFLFANLTFENVAEVAEGIMQKFVLGEYDKVVLVYNKFKNVMTEITQAQQIIPVESKENNEEKKLDSFYEFEPEENEILESLLPRNISTQIFKAFLENAASEQGSRMTAMDNATRNAGELVEKLTITYNRTRQAAITKELIEIIS